MDETTGEGVDDDGPGAGVSHSHAATPRWLSLAIFAGGVQHLDAALEQAVRPAMVAAREQCDVRRWYFVRYVDGRGPHIRLDVSTTDVDATERVLRDHLEPGLEGLRSQPVREPLLAPPASWQRGAEQRGVRPASHLADTERFTAEGLAAAEELFQTSSETVLTVLPSLPRGRERVACALHFMTALSELGLPREARAAFWDDVARSWTGDDERGMRLLERLGRHAERKAPVLVKDALRLSESDAIKAALATYLGACEAMLAGAPEAQRPALVRQHAHLTANRLGVAPLEEALLASALAQGTTSADDGGGAPSPQGDSALVLEGVTKQGDEHPVLDDVSIEVREREVFAILGPEGAGKSSLLGVAAGLRVASGGTVRVLGLDPRSDRERLEAEVGTALPDEQLIEASTVRENLDLRARLGGDRSVDDVLAIVGLTDRAGTPAVELDLGERRLLSIAAGLAAAPRLVLLDEPTAGLSAVERERVWGVLDVLRRDGVTVVFTTSSLQDALGAADRVALFLGGAVAEVSAPSEVAEQFPERVLRFRTLERFDAMLLEDLPEVRRVDVSEQPGHFDVEVATLQPDELLKLIGSDPEFPEIVWVAPDDVEGTFARPASGTPSEP